MDACGQGEGGKYLIFCGRHKWKAPYLLTFVKKSREFRVRELLVYLSYRRCDGSGENLFQIEWNG